MMKRIVKHTIAFFLVLGFYQTANAQDVHFSQVHATPLYNNPAMTGLINGNARAAAIYRKFSIGQGNGYRTISGSLDAKLLNISSDDDWISGGIFFFQDKAGSLDLSNNSVELALAYNAGIGGTGHYISIGVNGGILQRSINLNQAQFGEQFNGTEFDQGIPTTEVLMNDNTTTPNIGAGLMYYYINKSRKYAFIGAAANHINQAESTFLGTEAETQDLKIHINAGASLPIINGIDVVPTFYSALQGVHSQVNLGASFRFNMRANYSNQHSAILLGSNIRLSDLMHQAIADALIIIGRVELQSLTIGMSYDLVISDLNNTRAGATELSLVYELQTAKKSRRGGNISCPRF